MNHSPTRPPQMPISTDLTTIFYTFPDVRVYVSETLSGFANEDLAATPYLRCDRLRLACGPEIDQATLSYQYGDQLREGAGAFGVDAPLDLNGQFCKVVIPNGYLDAEGVQSDLTWYGVIEIDQRNPHGSVRAPTGRQSFTAFGLLRLLEQTEIRSTWIEPAAGFVGTDELPQQIGRGLIFNDDQHGHYSTGKNRSGTKDEVSGFYTFSRYERSTAQWTAKQAVEHLLYYHPPRDGDTEPVAQWVLQADENLLDWYKFAVPTDSRSVKQVLDDLINRRRGLGYWLDYDPATDKVTVHVFSFADAAINLPSGATLAANADQQSLDFEQAFDIEDVALRNSVATRYHTVKVQGAFRTATATFRLGPSEPLIEDWQAAEETAYIEGASNEAGYGALSYDEQIVANCRVRGSDALRHVFTRFRLDPEWDRLIFDADEEESFPLYDPADADDNAFAAGAAPLWVAGCTLLPKLPLKDRADYTGTKIADETVESGLADDDQPEWLDPLLLIQAVPDAKWLHGERLGDDRAEAGQGRRWNVGVELLRRQPGIQLRVSGGPNHFLDQTAWEAASPAPAIYDDRDEPAHNGGQDPDDIRITLCVQLDERVAERATIQPPPLGTPEQILYLQCPDARLDYVVPYTVVGLSNGGLQKSTSGGYVRDDRERLEDIARAAAEWYGKQRQALTMTYKQLRGVVRLGWLITDVGATYNLTGVNTPVTALEFDVLGKRTSFETSYSELDFV